jgi:hypothetical protein
MQGREEAALIRATRDHQANPECLLNSLRNFVPVMFFLIHKYIV